MRNICVDDAPFWDQNSERVKCFECKTATDSARAVTGAANAYKRRVIENSFRGTQMFVQARNYEYPQHKLHHTIV